jgi:hypothetical protein
MPLHVVGACHFGSPQLAKLADYSAKLAVRGGVEPPTFRYSESFADVTCGIVGNPDEMFNTPYRAVEHLV